MVKHNAPELLRREFVSKKWQPTTVHFSGITDSYQPIERNLKITRRCLEVCREFRNPAGVITKNALVTRDIDILRDLAAINASIVFLSITSLDPEMTAIMEPRTTRPSGRLAAIAKLHDAGIPVGVMAAPMIPGLTDHEMPAILAAAKDAGAQFAGYTIVRLPMAVGDVFAQWLERHFPDRKEKVLNRIREVHAGRLNDTRFKKRMAGDGELAEATRTLFRVTTRKLGMTGKPPPLRRKISAGRANIRNCFSVSHELRFSGKTGKLSRGLHRQVISFQRKKPAAVTKSIERERKGFAMFRKLVAPASVAAIGAVVLAIALVAFAPSARMYAPVPLLIPFAIALAGWRQSADEERHRSL